MSLLRIIFTVLGLSFMSLSYGQVTYTVNTINDSNDGVCNGTHCSLREAINAANTDGVASQINFSISGAAPYVIQPNSQLPTLTEANTTIYGHTGNSMIAEIELNGSNLSSSEVGLHITADNIYIKGLFIHSFPANGIRIDNANTVQVGTTNNSDINVISGNGQNTSLNISQRDGIAIDNSSNVRIVNNHIGTDRDGLNSYSGSNNTRGIYMTNCINSNNEIENGNIISGNTNSGIVVENSSDFIIRGNFIGTNNLDSSTMGNGEYGIIFIDCTDAGIGTTDATNNSLGRNIISGNHYAGVILTGSSGTRINIQNNYIGTNNVGTTSIPNGTALAGFDGVIIYQNSDITVGGIDVLSQNLISGNGRSGIFIDEATGVLIENNLIGTDITGMYAIPNNYSGITIENSNGPNFINKNTISGNITNQSSGGTGVRVLESHNTTISNNKIGTDITGTQAISNLSHGVILRNNSSNNVINNNIIAFNQLDGIATALGAINNRFSQNSIFCNTQEGIDEDQDGSGTSANGDKPIPIITEAFTNVIRGTATPNDLIELFYDDASCTVSNCQGSTYVGQTTTDVNGDWELHSSFSFGKNITATATDTNNTSEFSACKNIIDICLTVTNTNDSGPGSLRAAIHCANAPGATSRSINFLIQGATPHIIAPNTPLPALEGDGTTINANIDSSDSTEVHLVGYNIDDSYVGIGFDVKANDIEITGFYIHSFKANGIRVVDANNVKIGKSGYNFRNVIANNGLNGDGTFSIIGKDGINVNNVSDLIIENNFIGMNVTGLVKEGNSTRGISINGTSSDILIKDNLISGNNNTGLVIENGQNIEIKGNIVGTNVNSNMNIGNQYGMRFFDCENVIIGGDSKPECNVIAGNTANGIHIHGSNAKSYTIKGNLIGVGIDSLTAVPNAASGIYLENVDEAHIGGVVEEEKNIIAHNLVRAIYATQNTQNVIIRRNSIYCNNLSIGYTTTVNSNASIPTIDYVNTSEMKGTSTNAGDIIDIYYTPYNCQEFVDNPCQGKHYLATVTTDANGDWIYSLPINLTDTISTDDVFTAITTNLTVGQSSNLSACANILPDECRWADTLQYSYDCQTTGTLINLRNFTSSDPSSLSAAAATTFASGTANDAWYAITAPASGNCYIKLTNVNLNTIQPVMELYLDNSNPTDPDCIDLNGNGNFVYDSWSNFDDTYYFLLELSPNQVGYVRIWDENNLVVNDLTIPEATINISLHSLDNADQEYEICSFDGFSSFGGNTYMTQFPSGTPITDVLIEQNDAQNDGSTLIDECSCNGRVVQLWEVDDPIKLEERRQAAKNRARVDTTEYTFAFEEQDFQINIETAGDQNSPSTAMQPDGSFAIVWNDVVDGGNFIRLYNAAGNSVNTDLRLQSRTLNPKKTDVAALSTGYIATWYDNNSIKVREINNDATYHPNDIIDLSAPIGVEIELFSYPRIASNSNDEYVVLWEQDSTLIAQKFDNQSNTIGNPILIDWTYLKVQSTINCKIDYDIDINDIGEISVVWSGSENENQSYTDVYLAKYDADGNIISGHPKIVDISIKSQCKPSVAITNYGTSIVVWQQEGNISGSDNFDIKGKIFDSIGGEVDLTNALADNYVNSFYGDNQENPSVQLFKDDSFVVVWDTEHDSSNSSKEIYGRVFRKDGTSYIPNSEEFSINQVKAKNQNFPIVACADSLHFITVWQDEYSDTSQDGIFAQRHEISETNAYPIGTTTPSVLLGDTLYNSTIPFYVSSDSVSNVRVAVIDSGVDPMNAYLEQALWHNQQLDAYGCLANSNDDIGYDFAWEEGNPLDTIGHGTKVNGIIARNFDSNVQLELMNLKFHKGNQGKLFDAICSIYYAVDNGAKVINMSWGFIGNAIQPKMLKDALQYAYENDVLIVTTAGNTSKNNDDVNKYPANLDADNVYDSNTYELIAQNDTICMIVVTSYKEKDNVIELADYASYGANNVDIAAHGFIQTTHRTLNDDGSTVIPDSLTLAAGTSMAAPLVARTAATIRGLYPILTADEVKDCILNTAQYESNLDGLVLTNGILDHNAAIECARIKAQDCTAIDLYISPLQTLDSTYRTDAYIGSNATLSTTVDLEYLAADSIMLDADFCVPLGAEFLADIEDCDPLNNLTGTENDALFRIQEHSTNSGKVIAKFPAEIGDKICIRFFDEQKQLLDKWQADITQKGMFEKIIDVHRLPAGLYYIEYTNGDTLVERAVQVD